LLLEVLPWPDPYSRRSTPPPSWELVITPVEWSSSYVTTAVMLTNDYCYLMGEIELEVKLAAFFPEVPHWTLLEHGRYGVVYKPRKFELEADVIDNEVPEYFSELQLRRWHIPLFLEGDLVM
jgi:hypothetical protein